MLKAILLEDEADSAKLLTGFLQDYCPQVKVVAVVDNIATGLAAIYAHQPDVVFMDIELKGETCFDLLDKLGEIHFDIIFTTAYEAHAVKAFKLSAIDYLLKPINVQELQAAVDKVVKKGDQVIINRNIAALLNNLRDNLPGQKMGISTSDGVRFIKVSDIIYLRSEGSYTYFILKNNEKILTSKNIKEYEDLLDDHSFFRIHKSHIINQAEMLKYVRGDGGYVIMSNHDKLDVSRRRKDDFLHKFGTDA